MLVKARPPVLMKILLIAFKTLNFKHFTALKDDT